MKSSLPLLIGLIILSQSILSVSAAVPTSPPSSSAAPAGGYFSQYFSNMKTPCTGALDVITGFNGTMVRTCTPFANMMKGFLGTNTSSPGNVVTGFNTTTGLPTYGPGSPWMTSGTNVYYNAGNIGIGTSTPTAKLDVIGSIKIGNTAAVCNTANEGQLRYDALSKQMQFCNGTSWGSMAGGGLAGGSFGGMYTSNGGFMGAIKNPYTNNQSCPSGYTSVNIATSYNGPVLGSNSVYYCYKPGTVGSLSTVGAGQSCPSGKYVSGFDNNGVIQCKTLPASGGGGGGGGGMTCTSGHWTMGGYVCDSFSGPGIPGGFSDRKLKSNITPVQNSLYTLSQIQGVIWTWKNPEKYGATAPMGIIAQDVEKVYPALVTEVDGVKTVQYHALIGPLIEAVKELDAKNKKLEKDYTQKIEALEKHLEGIEKKLP